MKKKFPLLLLTLFLAGAFYNLWTLRPVKVLHASSDGYGDVELVVTHMPWTDMEKISWFILNREDIRAKYPLFPDVWHRYYITDIGDGFTNNKISPHEDLRCFSEIQNDKNCIVKNYLLVVDEYPDRYPRFREFR